MIKVRKYQFRIMRGRNTRYDYLKKFLVRCVKYFVKLEILQRMNLFMGAFAPGDFALFGTNFSLNILTTETNISPVNKFSKLHKCLAPIRIYSMMHSLRKASRMKNGYNSNTCTYYNYNNSR